MVKETLKASLMPFSHFKNVGFANLEGILHGSLKNSTSASSGLHKKIRKKGEIERNDPHAIK